MFFLLHLLDRDHRGLHAADKAARIVRAEPQAQQSAGAFKA
jgi:hypothetical protein